MNLLTDAQAFELGQKFHMSSAAVHALVLQAGDMIGASEALPEPEENETVKAYGARAFFRGIWAAKTVNNLPCIRERAIVLARRAGFIASVGPTTGGVYHPNVNALGREVPVEWIQKLVDIVTGADKG